MAILTAYATSHNNAVPTGFNAQLANQANAYGAPDGAVADGGAITSGQTAGNHFYFADLADIPDGSTINSVTLTVRSRLTNTGRGNYHYRIDSSPNTQIANEWSPTLQNQLNDQSNSTWSTTPSLAQLKASTFGVRARYARTATQAVTYELDAIAVVVDYDAPVTPVSGACAIAGAATVEAAGVPAVPAAAAISGVGTVAVSGTSVGGETTRSFRVTMDDPPADLIAGVGRQEVHVRARKQSGATSNPTLKLELYEAGGSTALATIIEETTVSSTTWNTFTGSFNASALAAISGADVELRVVNVTPGEDPALDIGAINWFATSAAVGYEVVQGAAAIAGSASVIPSPVTRKPASAAIAGAATLAAATVAAKQASAAISGSATAAVSGVTTKQGAAAISGVATVAASGETTSPATQGAASIAGSATVTPAGVTRKSGAAAIAGAASAAVSAQTYAVAAASISGAATLQVSSLRRVSAQADIAGSATVTPAGVTRKAAACAISATATVNVVTGGTAQGAVAIAGAATVSASGRLVKLGVVPIAGAATLSAAGRIPASAVISAMASATVAPLVVRLAIVPIAGAATLTPTPLVTRYAIIAISANGTVFAAPVRYLTGKYSPSSIVSMTNFAGQVADVQDSPSAPDENRLVATP